MRYSRLVTWGIFVVVLLTAMLSRHSVTAEGNTTINASLKVYSPALAFANESFTIKASYTSNGTIASANACSLEGETMSFNMSSGLYYHSLSLGGGNHSLEVNCYKEGYENLTSLFDVVVVRRVTDADGDGYEASEDCNDNNAFVSPGMDEKLYNGVDDDCNPDTFDYLEFELGVDKQSYSPQSNAKILIQARNGSDTYLTINTPSNISYVYVFSNGTYPVTQQYSLTGMSGQYSIEAVNYFGNYSVEDYAEFTVDDTFDVDIEASRTKAATGESIHLKAVVTGAVGNTNMVWMMDDGTDKYDAEFDYPYEQDGEYNVVLMATDQAGNQATDSITLQIYDEFYLKVKVVDNKTGTKIVDATVELDSDSKDVNASGMAEFKTRNKTYELEVSATNYYTYRDDIETTNDLVFTVRLNKVKVNAPPTVTLVSPANGSSSDVLDFTFKFEDEQKANCTLLLSEGDGWWTETDIKANLQPGKHTLKGGNFEKDSYVWKVHCTDASGKTGYSPSRIINKKVEMVTYNVVNDIYALLPDFKDSSPDEKKAVEYLGIDIQVKDAKRKLDMANRDLFNLANKASTDEMLEERDAIYATIDEIKDKAPRMVTIGDKVEFVKYVSDEAAEELLTQYFSSEEYTKRELKNLIETNILLQKQATIKTSAYNVRVQYISGRNEDFTLVIREIDFEGSKGIIYAEYLPGTMKDVVFMQDHEKKGGFVTTSTLGLEEFSYYMQGEVSLDTIPQAKPLFITTIIPEGNTVTGMAIFDAPSKQKIFIAEIVVVFILLGVYLHFSKGAVSLQPSKKPKPVDIGHGDPHKADYLGKVIAKANHALKNNNLKDAALKYHEIKFLYDLLDENSKKLMFNRVIGIADKIAFEHIRTLTDEAVVMLAKGEKEQARELYNEIEQEFGKLSEDMKREVYPRCCEVWLHLNDN